MKFDLTDEEMTALIDMAHICFTFSEEYQREHDEIAIPAATPEIEALVHRLMALDAGDNEGCDVRDRALIEKYGSRYAVDPKTRQLKRFRPEDQ
jgi:hypothetical protein